MDKLHWDSRDLNITNIASNKNPNELDSSNSLTVKSSVDNTTSTINLPANESISSNGSISSNEIILTNGSISSNGSISNGSISSHGSYTSTDSSLRTYISPLSTMSNSDKSNSLDLFEDLSLDNNKLFEIPSKSKVSKPKVRKRSKTGCVSCKRLKIKCSEDKPVCEYCLHTNRECIYPNSMIINNCQSTKNLNSTNVHLNITRSELRLLKFFTEFSGSFFSFNKVDQLKNLWSIEVPKLWNQSDLVKNAIFTMSSIRLWAEYELNNIHTIRLEYDEEDEQKNNTLLDKTSSYFSKTLQLIQNTTPVDYDSTIQSVIAHIIVFTYVSIHPLPPLSLVSFNNEQSVDLFHISESLHINFIEGYEFFKDSKFEILSNAGERSIFIPEKTYESMFPFINYLKKYVTDSDCDDLGFVSYMNVIDQIELGCYRSLKLEYPLPIFRTIFGISREKDFVILLRQMDHIALKIMFYFSSLCSIYGFKLFKKFGVWDEYINKFILVCRDKGFTSVNGLEDKFDANLYYTAKLFQNDIVDIDLFETNLKLMELLKCVGMEDLTVQDMIGNLKVISMGDIIQNESSVAIELNQFMQFS
ncbi:hypothetical protein WICMUC_002507 [Wickerhamomyces mucosus]|uniref:Zn(2)-C6 fungal-type domain-containing protein n=1 Tax=Wickerhamomyces mucosus TaxID=1378264 RepID=A0A9P8PQ96_9ASCO|nr:hypothetical protein WICMUC_002507 [Wickerhamomyces mucosus]